MLSSQCHHRLSSILSVSSCFSSEVNCKVYEMGALTMDQDNPLSIF